jgi:hypothetical protein
MAVIPLRKEQPPPAPIRKLTVSRIDGHREWSAGVSYLMIASSDGSVELIGSRKTLHIADGKRLAATLGRYAMQPWTDGDLSVRWVYGTADGVSSEYGGRRDEHWLWLDIAIGEKTYPPTNPTRAGQTYIETQHVVLANSSATYHGKKLRDALRRLG